MTFTVAAVPQAAPYGAFIRTTCDSCGQTVWAGEHTDDQTLADECAGHRCMSGEVR